jgi:hypothetical protein
MADRNRADRERGTDDALDEERIRGIGDEEEEDFEATEDLEKSDDEEDDQEGTF